MKKKPVILFGVGEVAEVFYMYLTHDSEYKVVAFTVDREFKKQAKKFSLPVVAFEEVEKKYTPEKYAMAVTISFSGVNRLREEKYRQAKKKGYRLISYVSSKASVWPNVKIGENTFVMENNVLQPFVKVGNDVILWSGNHVGHHSKIGDHCFVASQVVVSGHVKVGKRCFLGVNATIRDNISLADETVLGAGALVTKDTQKGGVYYAAGANIPKKAGDSRKLKKI